MRLRRRVMVSGKKPLLPPEYQQVEWIQNPNNRYIITDFYNSYNNIITLVFQQSKTPGRYDVLFGSQYNNAGTDRTWFGYRKTAVSCSWCGSNSGAIANTSDLLEHTLTASKDGFYLDGNLIFTPSDKRNSSVRPIYLFCNNFATQGRDYPASGLRIIRFTVEGASGTILDYVPCVRVTDGVAGLYDLVSKTFYEGQGSSSNFVPGNYV